MNLKPEDLEKNGYVLIDRLDHEDLIPFVRKYLYRPGFWPIFFFGFCLLLLVIIGLLIRNGAVSGQFIASKAWGNAAIGFALTFLLIPLHEYIHAVVYRLCGARKVSYDADLRRFIFMAIAHRFVAGANEFRLVAIAPFATISIVAASIIPFLTGSHIFIILGLIFAHATCCSGDFAMLSYLNFHRDKHIVTWDDDENKVSYFYGKPKIN